MTHPKHPHLAAVQLTDHGAVHAGRHTCTPGQYAPCCGAGVRNTPEGRHVGTGEATDKPINCGRCQLDHAEQFNAVAEAQAPARATLARWRVLRPAHMSPCALYYRTEQARDAAAQRWANLTGETMLTELWTAEQARTLDPINGGWATDGTVKPTTATVTMRIENHYTVSGSVEPDVVVTTVTAAIPPPPPQDCEDAYDTWQNTHIHGHTGTVRDGDACYFVEITESTIAALVGRKFEFFGV